MKIKIVLLVCGLLFGFLGHYGYDKYLQKGASIHVKFEPAKITTNNISCSGLTGVMFQNEPSFEKMNTGTGEIWKSTEKISMKIDDKTLMYLNGASFENGRTEGSPLNIIENNEQRLVAISVNDNTQLFSNSVNVLALDKSNGLAMWSKSSGHNPLIQGPTLDGAYMSCK